MKKYIKPFLFVLFNNVFLMMIQVTFVNYEQYGVFSIIAFCLLWFLTFNMLVVGMAHTWIPSEKEESNIVPFTNITGEHLLDVLKIKGNLAFSYENGFTDEEIYEALIRCKELLNNGRTRFFEKENIDITLSDRQNFCSNATIQLIMQNKYIHALHEFEDCIDDYGRGKMRNVTINEYILYNCILNCFLARLEKQSETLNQ